MCKGIKVPLLYMNPWQEDEDSVTNSFPFHSSSWACVEDAAEPALFDWSKFTAATSDFVGAATYRCLWIVGTLVKTKRQVSPETHTTIRLLKFKCLQIYNTAWWFFMTCNTIILPCWQIWFWNNSNIKAFLQNWFKEFKFKVTTLTLQQHVKTDNDG